MFSLLFNAWGLRVLIHQRDAYYSVTVLSIGGDANYAAT